MSRFVLSCTTCATRGISTQGDDRDEVKACFRYAPRAGYKYWGMAGPPLWFIGGARWFDARRVSGLAKRAGLKGCTEVYGPQFPTDSPAAAEEAAEEIARMFEVARDMRSPLVVITGGKRVGRSGLDASIAGVRRLLTLVRGMPVRLALEPHFGSQFQSREDYDALFSALDDPQVGITVDTGHFHSAGVDWKALIRAYAPKICNVHLKDHRGTQSVPVGAGEIDLKGVIETLHEISYEGALAVELEVVDSQNLPRYIAEAHDYLLRTVRDVTGRDPL